MKTITPAEAIVALAEGKSIISNWDTRPAKIIKGDVYYPDGNPVGLSSLLAHKNLRIYEEPKAQIEVALYAYFNGSRWVTTNGYFRDDSDFINIFGELKFKRLDGIKDTTMLVDEY